MGERRVDDPRVRHSENQLVSADRRDEIAFREHTFVRDPAEIDEVVQQLIALRQPRQCAAFDFAVLGWNEAVRVLTADER